MRLLLILTTFLIIGFNGKAQINKEVIDSIVQNATSAKSFEGTVLIAQNGNVAYLKSLGFKDQKRLYR